MTIKSFFKTCLVTAVLGSFVFLGASCQKETPAEDGNGTITGTVSDSNGNPVEGVTVSTNNTEGTATTGADGTYTLSNVPIETLSVTFSKEGYQTASVTVPASRFSDGTATVNATLTVADARITGTILDGAAGNAPLEGATVTLNNGTTATTGSDGTFTIESLTVRDYTVTISAEGYISSTVEVTEADFNNEENTATVDATLYKTILLPGLTLSDLQNADKWYYNEYRGGTGGTEYPRWDWSTAFMGSLNYYGQHSEIGEGSDICINSENNSTADLNNYASYLWGSKLITEDNNIMTVRARTFADRDGATVWNVSVVDMSAAEPTAVKLGEDITSENTDYEDYHFDLSAYNGKEIVIAVGVYCAEAEKEKHFAIKRINFTKEEMTGWEWIRGTDVPGLEGWHMTQEMVRSTMVNEKTQFSGVTTVSSDDRTAAFQSWRENDHIGATWGFTVITKDTEIFAGQGAIIKTRGGSDYTVNTQVPESYFYSKFNISDANDQITFRLRTFGTNFTFFKLTAISVDDMSVKHLTPTVKEVHTAQSDGAVQGREEAGPDGCWKFINDVGETSDPDSYATFSYDLSEFNGKDIVLCIGVFKGEENGDENKICFYSVELN